jgi:cell division protein FtsL
LHITRGNTATAYRQSLWQKEVNQESKKRSLLKSRVKPLALYSIAIGLLVLFALVYLSQYAFLAQLNQQIYSLRGEVKKLERQNRDLQRQVAGLASLDRVERLAREEIGMVASADIRYIVLDNDFSPGVAADVEKTNPQDSSRTGKWWQLSKSAFARGSIQD